MSSSNLRLKILKRLLNSVVRVCLRYGYSIQELIEAAKATFILVSKSEIENKGEKCNISRLSVMSGLHRRDVMRILDDAEGPQDSLSVVNRVIGQWCNDKRFCKKRGQPRVLSYQGIQDEFSRLVQTISHDLHPGTVLFELKRREVVEEVKEGVKLKSAVFESNRNHVDGLQMLAEDVDDLTRAVLENISNESVTHLHSKTEFDKIPIDKIPQISQWLLKKGASWQQETREYLASFDLDISGKSVETTYARVVCGVFSLTEESLIPSEQQRISEEDSISKGRKNVSKKRTLL
jgi:hypothetical protein